MLCTDTVSFWIKGLCQKAELVARNDCKYFRDLYVCFQLILIFWNLLLQRHINLAQHLSTFTSKPAFLGQLDMEHTIVEAQSYDMWAKFLLLSPTFEDLMCWLYVFRFIIYVNILNAKACWLGSKWFTEFQD